MQKKGRSGTDKPKVEHDRGALCVLVAMIRRSPNVATQVMSKMEKACWAMQESKSFFAEHFEGYARDVHVPQ